MKALAGGFNHPIKNICNSSKNPSNHHLVDYTNYWSQLPTNGDQVTPHATPSVDSYDFLAPKPAMCFVVPWDHHDDPTWRSTGNLLKKPPKKGGGNGRFRRPLSFSDFVTVWVLVLLFPCHGCLVRCFFSFLWLHSSKLRMAARVDNVDRLMANCWVLASGHGVFLNRLLFSENIFVKCFNGSWESYFEFQE